MGKIVLIACTNVGRSLIETIENSRKLQGVELSGVVNLKTEIAIEKANYDSYLDLVKKYNLNMFYCENVNDAECLDFIRKCSPDVIIQSGWSQKFSEELLDIPAYACIGEHPAPLPKGRGAACVNWAIISGEREWGDTFFKMEMKYDTGLIYSQEYFNIEIYDDVKTVYDKVAQAATTAIEKHLYDWTEGRLEGYKQDDSKATHYSRRRPSDGKLDLRQAAIDIYNQIRGQARPYPGAYIELLDGRKMYIWKARLGEKCADYERKLKCGDGNSIIIQRVQIEGEPEKWSGDLESEEWSFEGSWWLPC